MRTFKRRPLRDRKHIAHPRTTSYFWLTIAILLSFTALVAFLWSYTACLMQDTTSTVSVLPRPKAAQPSPVYKVVRTIPNQVTTAYNPVPAQTDQNPCIAANGTDICAGMAKGKKYAAANALPFGTLIRVHGVVYEVVDRSGKPGIVDLAFPANELREAKQWGRRRVLVEVVQEV